MAESGIVTRIDGKFVEIELIRSEACKHCNACLPSLTDKTMILRAENACQAKVGDRVRISVQQNGFLAAVCLLYVIPAIVFVLLIVLLSLLGWNEWAVFGCAVIGVAVAYLILHRLTPKLNQKRFSPVAEEIIS